jgi:hypothetical protein
MKEAAGVAGQVFVGFGASGVIVQDWVSTAMLAAAALPTTLATFSVHLIKNIERRIQEQLDTLQENKLYYYVGAQDVLASMSHDPPNE